jgi:hypothetical protein
VIHSHETQRDKERRGHAKKGQEVLITFLDCSLRHSDTLVMHENGAKEKRRTRVAYTIPISKEEKTTTKVRNINAQTVFDRFGS